MYDAHQTTTITREQEDLMLEAACLHQVADWEGLMQAHVTPALVVGGERRLHRESSAATKRVS